MAFDTEVDSESFAFGPSGYIPQGKHARTPEAQTAIDNAALEADGVDTGAKSPGPGPTDGLEPGTDDPPNVIGTRTKSGDTHVSIGMGRRGYSPVATTLQGSRKLG